MKKPKLIFSNDGTSVHIKFLNGKESFDFESKEDALFALQQCLQRKKLTSDDVCRMYKEIILSEKLPECNSEVSFLRFAISGTFNNILEIDISQKIEIEDPIVQMCDCGLKIKHAYIYNGNGDKIGLPFLFKTEGLSFVDHLLKHEHISEADSISLNILISFLPIPENASPN